MKFAILKGILRGAVRDRLLTLVNVSGMIAGLTAGILILSFAVEEYAHDEFHEHADRIVRIDVLSTNDGETKRWADSPYRLRDELQASYPEVEDATRYMPAFGVVQNGDAVSYQGFAFVDPAFLTMFSFELEEGDANVALSPPGSIVLSRETADRLFPRGDAYGQSLQVKIGEQFEPVTVTGIIENPPPTSSIQYHALLPFDMAWGSQVQQETYDRWRGQTGTFALLRPTTDPNRLVSKLSHLQDTRGEAFLDGRQAVEFTYTPLKDVYFDHGALTRGITVASNPRTANTLIALALLIITIAAANFTTLSVAQSTRQTRAVGIRKVIGASRFEIAREYLTESILKTFVAALIAISLADLLASPFAALTGSPVDVGILMRPSYLIVLAVLITGTGLLSGLYPAVYLSRIRPIGVLHGDRIRRGTSKLIRSVVVVQFAATAVLMIAAWTMSKQIGYLGSIDLGLDADNVLVIEPDFTNAQTVPSVFRTLEGADAPGIEAVARSSGMIARSFGTMEVTTAAGETERANIFGVSPGYMSLLGIDLAAGSPTDVSRPQELVVNGPFLDLLEKDAARAVGTAVGDQWRISGVMNDFYHHSVRSELRPLALYPITDEYPGGYILVRAQPGRMTEAVASARDAWQRAAPDVPFQYYWLDEDVSRQAGSATRWNRIMRASTLFAMLIACLGLFGLSTLAALRRTKEVGIRKVLGADPLRVTSLLVRDTALSALAAAVVGIPIGWLIMNRWLEDFANRVSIGVGELGLVAATLVLVALITVSFQSMRAALRNPVDSLRHE